MLKVQVAMTLEDILIFFSGSREVPPLGFTPSGNVTFSNEETYPKASTCALTLILPTKYHKDYATFKDKVSFAVKNHGGFGLP